MNQKQAVQEDEHVFSEDSSLLQVMLLQLFWGCERRERVGW